MSDQEHRTSNALLREAADFVGKSKCSVGHPLQDIRNNAKARRCIYCEHQVDLWDRLSAAIQQPAHEPESWRPTNQQCDQIIGALEDHEWSGFSREDIRRLVNVIDQHRPSQPPVPAPSTSEIATFIRCREAIKAVDDGDSPAYAHAMEVIDDLISGAAHVRASQPPDEALSILRAVYREADNYGSVSEETMQAIELYLQRSLTKEPVR